MWKRLDEKIKPGDIILSHNGTKHTAESLDKIISNIQQKGFSVVPVSELIYKENDIIDERRSPKTRDKAIKKSIKNIN